MTNFVTSILRTLAQVVVGYLVTWAAARGLDIPQQVRDWVLGAIVAGGILAWTALVRWLETRKGTGTLATACRKLAAVLMLGLGGAKPVYVPAGGAVQGTSDQAGTHSVAIGDPVPDAPETGRHAAALPEDTGSRVVYDPGRADPDTARAVTEGMHRAWRGRDGSDIL